jgi:hypothetical protein
VISNATSKGNPQQIASLVDIGVIDLFVHLLDSKDPKIITIVLEALRNILKCGTEHFVNDGENIFLKLFEEKNGMNKLESLQTHPSNDVYSKALNILELFYEFEDILDF